MSRIGKMPVKVPQGVDVTLNDGSVRVKGPKGTLEHAIPEGIVCQVDGDVLTVTRRDDSKPQRALHGLVRALVANAVHGASEGFTRVLEIEGIGYKAEASGQKLTLNLGYSHPIEYEVPKEVQVAVEKQNRITLAGADKQQVGQIAAEIRAMRPPEPYKGKGIRYENEYIRRKVGKTGA